MQFNDSHSFETENGTGRAPSPDHRVSQPPKTAWRGHTEVRGNETKQHVHALVLWNAMLAQHPQHGGSVAEPS